MNALSRLVVMAAVVSVMGSGVPALAAATAGEAVEKKGGRSAPGGSIVSFVRDQAGHPLAGAVVSAIGRRIVTSVTDTEGRCVFNALPAGDYLVRVHRAGFVSTSSLLVLAGPGASSTWSFVLKQQPATAATPSDVRKSSTVLAAGIVGTSSDSSIEPVRPAQDDEESHDHGEVAWRLKHLKRSVLKEATERAIYDDEGDSEEFDQAVAEMFARRPGPAQVFASLLGDFPLAGQVNLLTTGAFDSPEQLVSAGSLARGVAMVSLGAAAGRSGDWAVQGAMTQGDVASWMVSGSYLSRAPASHVYDVGMSYSLQRYDGANPAALAAVADGDRYAGVVHAFDSWSLNEHVSLQYGARYAKYGYIEKSLLSPRARVRFTPVEGTRLTVGASRRALAPGAEEFVPSMVAGTWLPPERTFAPITGSVFIPERTEHFDIGAEHDVTESTMVGLRAFYQRSEDQIATVFGAAGEPEMRTASELGHYYVGTAGDVDARGWTVSVRHVIARRVRGSIDYTVTTAQWHETPESDDVARRLSGLVRTGRERLHDITTSVETELPVTETRVFALYRVNTGYASDLGEGIEPSIDARFDVQVTQSLPFMNFANAQWEMLLGVRNLFRDVVDEASVYDELLVVRPPKRIVGGLTLRF